MINRLINEIRKCMDCDCLLAGLALALILPDICGKAEFPQENSSKKRYIQWYDETVGITEKPPKSTKRNTEMPYLSGEVIYSLRCQFLHQGTPNIEAAKIKEAACKIDDFTLLLQKKTRSIYIQIPPLCSTVEQTLMVIILYISSGHMR